VVLDAFGRVDLVGEHSGCVIGCDTFGFRIRGCHRQHLLDGDADIGA